MPISCIARACSLVLGVVMAAPAALGASFVHPGVMHTQADIDRIKANLTVAPWSGSFALLRDHRYSSKSYVVRGGTCPNVVRDSISTCMGEFTDDANAAYQQALMWVLTGDSAYAAKGIQVLNAWSSSLQTISGHDAKLAVGINGFKFAAAAELLRHTQAGWSTANIAAAEKMFRDVFYPVIKDFATDANGGWDIACMKGMLAFGVFTNDRAMFNRALDYYYNGPSNGRLTHYIINTSGQTQEAGRDQQHAQFAIGSMAEFAEVAWSQGIDAYGAYNSRLLRGFEYIAAYNLGNEVPFVPMTDTTGKYPQSTISSLYRGELRPIYEMVLNHYRSRKLISAPYTEQAAIKLRPEGVAVGADHPGFGSVLFTRAVSATAVAPAGTGDFPIGFTKCADENGVCSVPKGTGLVAYGLKGSWHYKQVGTGASAVCNGGTFGDPLPGVAKKCAYQL